MNRLNCHLDEPCIHCKDLEACLYEYWKDCDGTRILYADWRRDNCLNYIHWGGEVSV